MPPKRLKKMTIESEWENFKKTNDKIFPKKYYETNNHIKKNDQVFENQKRNFDIQKKIKFKNQDNKLFEITNKEDNESVFHNNYSMNEYEDEPFILLEDDLELKSNNKKNPDLSFVDDVKKNSEIIYNFIESIFKKLITLSNFNSHVNDLDSNEDIFMLVSNSISNQKNNEILLLSEEYKQEIINKLLCLFKSHAYKSLEDTISDKNGLNLKTQMSDRIVEYIRLKSISGQQIEFIQRDSIQKIPNNNSLKKKKIPISEESKQITIYVDNLISNAEFPKILNDTKLNPNESNKKSKLKDQKVLKSKCCISQFRFTCATKTHVIVKYNPNDEFDYGISFKNNNISNNDSLKNKQPNNNNNNDIKTQKQFAIFDLSLRFFEFLYQIHYIQNYDSFVDWYISDYIQKNITIPCTKIDSEYKNFILTPEFEKIFTILKEKIEFIEEFNNLFETMNCE